jgi:hypothetical protein
MDANEAANSIARIGTYSLDIRPSHSTTALALLVVMLRTTPRRPLQTDLPPRLLLNVATARAVSFTLSPCLINFSFSVSPCYSRGGNGGYVMARDCYFAPNFCSLRT